MKKSLITTLSILILVSSLHSKQNPKQVYNANQLKYRDIKNNIIENEQNLISNLRDINSKKVYAYNSNNTVKKDPREKEELRRVKKSLDREKLVRTVRYR